MTNTNTTPENYSNYSAQPPLVTSPYLSPAPKPPVKKQAWWKKPIVIVGAAALILGLGIGTASAKTETVEVEKRVEVPGPERVVTKEVKVNVPSTPAACIEYIDLSEQAFDYSSEAMGYMGEALTAAGQMDVAGLDAASQRIKSVTPKLQAMTPDVQRAKAECRAS